MESNAPALRATALRALAGLTAAAALAAAPLDPAAAAPIASGYDVGFLTTPGTATGDVVAVGGAVFVASGPFGSQSIVRIDAGGATVLADGFSGVGGIAYDAANDRLIVGDNATGALTGDTIYGISSPFGSPVTPPDASTLELLPAGSLPGVADLVVDPSDPSGNTLFVTDASEAFPPLGELLAVSLLSPSITTVQTGLEFAAGVATDGVALFYADALLAGGGDLSAVPAGSPSGTPALVGHYPGGLFDIEVSGDGAIVASSGGSILRIDPVTGAATEIASGFGFAAGLYAADDGTIYAIDGFASAGELDRVWVFTPIPEPASAPLAALGLAALARRRPRRRRSQSGSRNEKCTGTVTRP